MAFWLGFPLPKMLPSMSSVLSNRPPGLMKSLHKSGTLLKPSPKNSLFNAILYVVNLAQLCSSYVKHF